jgi:hypothetical protein
MAAPKGNKYATGRPKGAQNKVTADIKALCQAAAPVAIERLIAIAQTADSQATQVAAIKELLDRGYGKATQQSDVKVTGSEVIIIKPRGVE